MDQLKAMEQDISTGQGAMKYDIERKINTGQDKVKKSIVLWKQK
jgi:hypothetical protein